MHCHFRLPLIDYTGHSSRPERLHEPPTPLVRQLFSRALLLAVQQRSEILVQVSAGAVVADAVVAVSEGAPLHLLGWDAGADEEVDKCCCVLVVDVVVAEAVQDGEAAGDVPEAVDLAYGGAVVRVRPKVLPLKIRW